MGNDPAEAGARKRSSLGKKRSSLGGSHLVKGGVVNHFRLSIPQVPW